MYLELKSGDIDKHGSHNYEIPTSKYKVHMLSRILTFEFVVASIASGYDIAPSHFDLAYWLFEHAAEGSILLIVAVSRDTRQAS
eukprot:SAG11_NODE_15398_length_579_cov_1.479167_1_plen_84_part_00